MDRRIEVFGKIYKKKSGQGGREGSGGGVGLVGGRVGRGDQGGCERRIEVFCENSKKNGGVGGRGVGLGGHGGCERRIEVLGKIHQKKSGGGGREGRGQVGGRVGGGVRVDVNAMLGVGGDVGHGGCEPRIEYNVQKGIVQY